ncbi:MAG: oxaloacetate decarboxylase [Steroidobacteraceae bacterium]
MTSHTDCTTPATTPQARLRRLLARDGVLMAPGVADALNARIVAKHGFEAVYMTGAGATAVRLGMPDVGLMTMTEMVDNAARIYNACNLPVIADADTGYGGVHNVRRTVQSYERAGIAAIHLEDQSLPKRCGHLAGKELIAPSEMVAKIKAACDARVDPDFMIIARTDAIAVEGFEAAIERAECYAEAGADMLFVEAPSAEQLPLIAPRLHKPLLYNMGASGKTPFLDKSTIEDLGFKLIIYPNWLLLAGIRASGKMLELLKSSGSIADAVSEVASFREFFDLVGMQDVQHLDAKYAAKPDNLIKY